ncbi:hypothetical protein IAQ61_006102 [Plenodomus lingam]|uniref:uncharacterized protein n=1 Tax=Leptosphaeria maculans TaxID=5022 RepID=UPI003320126B|nr:hypothetical protein IAQ61_006102 [Plenodomus lingam]
MQDPKEQKYPQLTCRRKTSLDYHFNLENFSTLQHIIRRKVIYDDSIESFCAVMDDHCLVQQCLWKEMDKSGKTPDALLSESVFQAADIVHKVDSSLPNQAQSLTHERLNNVYKRTKHAHRLAFSSHIDNAIWLDKQN